MIAKSYFGCLVRQRVNENTIPFFVFYARIKDIKEWAGIRRVRDLPEGTQRTFRKTRVRQIARFLQSNPTNTIPNSMLLAFNPSQAHFAPVNMSVDPNLELTNQCGDQLQWGFLHFEFDPNMEEHLRPALVVDGQHRLHGMSSFESENLPMLIVSLVDAPLQEQAFQFIVVNSRAIRVSTTTAKSIIADIQEDELAQRLLSAGIPYGDMSPTLRDVHDLPSSPFYKLLDWERNREESRDDQPLVPLTAIEQSLRHIRNVFGNFLSDDEDSLIQIFMAIWRAIKNRYPELWGRSSKFMTKVNLNALNEFVVEKLKNAFMFGMIEDIFDIFAVERWVTKLIEHIPHEFWEYEWRIRVQDNANVRQQIKEDLETISDNYKLQKNWSDELKLPIPSLFPLMGM